MCAPGRLARSTELTTETADPIAADSADHQPLLRIAEQPLRPVDAAAVGELYRLVGIGCAVDPEAQSAIVAPASRARRFEHGIDAGKLAAHAVEQLFAGLGE